MLHNGELSLSAIFDGFDNKSDYFKVTSVLLAEWKATQTISLLKRNIRKIAVNYVLLHMAHHSVLVRVNDLSRFSVDRIEKANRAVERVESHGIATRQIYNMVN